MSAWLFILLISTAFAEPIVVAIIDTGCDLDHSLLKEMRWQNPGESGLDKNGGERATNQIDDDKNGYIDDIYGWDFITNSPHASDDHGHGTHVAGLVANIAKQARVEKQIKFMVLKYYSSRAYHKQTVDYTVAAIAYAVKMGAKIINYSGGGSLPNSDEYHELLKAQRAQILVVAAAGNDGRNADLRPYFPAGYDLDNILSVAAISPKHSLIPASNWGIKNVDLAALGEDVLSALPKEAWGKMTGTSQATAIASGVAAAILAKNRALREPQEVIQLMAQTAVSPSRLRQKTKFGGYLEPTVSLSMRDENLSALGGFKKLPLERRPSSP